MACGLANRCKMLGFPGETKSETGEILILIPESGRLRWNMPSLRHLINVTASRESSIRSCWARTTFTARAGMAHRSEIDADSRLIMSTLY